MHQLNHGGFSVPDAYFSQARQQLVAKTTPLTLQYTGRKWWPYVTAAAAVLVVMSVGWFAQPGTTQQGLTDDEILNYVTVNNVADVPITELVSEHTSDPVDDDLLNELDEEILITEL